MGKKTALPFSRDGLARAPAGFTLIEVFAVMAVLVIVVGMAIPLYTGYQREGRRATEISAARKLAAGYLLYAAENDGFLMPGYASADTEASNAGGDPIHFPASARYPWRLAPYLEYDMNAILFNGNQRALVGKVDNSYAASVSPNLGLNAVFVGGHFGSGSPLVPDESGTRRFGSFCVLHLSQAVKPSSLIVFASARRSKTEVGNYEIRAPSVTASVWSGKWNENAPASGYGFLDMRYDRKAVAAMLDGHVQLLDEDEVQDMRRWSNQAAEQDRANFTITRTR